MIPLDQLEVVVLDCQTTGASPKHGHLLELAWSVRRVEFLFVTPPVMAAAAAKLATST